MYIFHRYCKRPHQEFHWPLLSTIIYTFTVSTYRVNLLFKNWKQLQVPFIFLKTLNIESIIFLILLLSLKQHAFFYTN